MKKPRCAIFEKDHESQSIVFLNNSMTPRAALLLAVNHIDPRLEPRGFHAQLERAKVVIDAVATNLEP